MKPLEIIGLILLGLCVISVLCLFAFYPFPKSKMEHASIMNLQVYNVTGVNGKPMKEYVIGFLSDTGTIFEITVKETRP